MYYAQARIINPPAEDNGGGSLEICMCTQAYIMSAAICKHICDLELGSHQLFSNADAFALLRRTVYAVRKVVGSGEIHIISFAASLVCVIFPPACVWIMGMNGIVFLHAMPLIN